MTVLAKALEFELPDSSVGTLPAEQRGTGRDDVKLMVNHRSTGVIEHLRFPDIVDQLDPGDVLVVNTSGTVAAAIDGWSTMGTRLRVHFASPIPGGLWSVEIRRPEDDGATKPGPDWSPQTLLLAGGARLHLLTRNHTSPRTWVAEMDDVADVLSYLLEHGAPIRYTPGPPLPLAAYQTVFSTEPGSAEMPSAARPFTTDLVTRLTSKGVVVVPVTLHAGVSSYETDEGPGDERYRVPDHTAAVVNAVRGAGGRVFATGTTVVRALETVADGTGEVHPGRGITDKLITVSTGLQVVDGLITGWHEPRSSHLMLLEAFLDRERLDLVYREALQAGYLWHEFGDILLIVP